MARRTGRAKPMTAKAGVTKTKRRYATITWILNIIDLYIGIPVSDIWYLGIQLIIAGISLFIILYLYVKSHKKSTVKDSR